MSITIKEAIRIAAEKNITLEQYVSGYIKLNVTETIKLNEISYDEAKKEFYPSSIKAYKDGN